MKIDNIARVGRGFTIWELLCIIIVILLLIGLLMPALTRVRKQSKEVVCMAILRQYSISGILYLDDNNKTFPSGENEWLFTKESFSAEHPMACRWHDMAMAPSGKIMSENPQYQGKLWNYMNHDKYNICPQFRSIASTKKCPNPDHLKKIDIVPQYSYTMNAYLGSDKLGGASTYSQVGNPGKIFFFAEENSWTIGPDKIKYREQKLTIALSTKALDDTILTISPTEKALDCFATYHDPQSGDINRGCCNAAFIDGHVDRITIREQMENSERGWPEGTIGNITYAWAAKTLPVNNPDQK